MVSASDSLGLVNIGLVNSVPKLPDEQLKSFTGNSNHRRTVINPACIFCFLFFCFLRTVQKVFLAISKC